MTAFLKVEVLRAHAAPVELRDAPHRAGCRCPGLTLRWHFMADGPPMGRWRTNDTAPEFPPD